jgi:DNA-binding HxlR family transcriptional regulator
MTTEAAGCPVEAVVAVIGGKWKTGILYNLLHRPHRFGELRRALGPITEKMLIQQLRELEAEGVVRRHAFPEIPPRVEYSLTEHGLALRPALEALRAWGEVHRRRGGVVERDEG